MNATTKVRIDLNAGIIEIEGSEQFVTKYLDEFKTLIGRVPNSTKAHRKSNRSRPKKNDEGDDSKDKKKVVPKKIKVEEFDIDGNTKEGISSLKEFLDEKKAMESAPKAIIAVGYYITHLLGESEFSEGNIEFAYKALRLTGRPTHLHQIIINRKNSDAWFEQGSDSTHWKLSRVGQLYVEESMK